MIAQEQRGKVLEQYRYFDEYCLAAIDASGYFSSNEIHCDSCCKKNHRDGTVTYYHQMLAAVMVHPGIAFDFQSRSLIMICRKVSTAIPIWFRSNNFSCAKVGPKSA